MAGMVFHWHAPLRHWNNPRNTRGFFRPLRPSIELGIASLCLASNLKKAKQRSYQSALLQFSVCDSVALHLHGHPVDGIAQAGVGNIEVFELRKTVVQDSQTVGRLIGQDFCLRDIQVSAENGKYLQESRRYGND